MKLKCLIVEDAMFIREIYRMNLAHQNYEIIAEATDGVQALALIKEHKPDIVILDIVLPLKNGLDVLKEAHSISSTSRYLIVSSLDDQATIDKAKSLGATDYLVKPFSKLQLLQSLERISHNYHEVQNG